MASQAREQSGISLDETDQTFSILVSLNGATAERVVVAPLTFTILENAQRTAVLKKFARELEVEVSDLPIDCELAGLVWTVLRRDDSTLTYHDVAGSISGMDIIAPVIEPDATDPS